MSFLHDLVISFHSTFRVAMELINKNSVQICFIVDAENKLMGALSDGDIRRALLQGATLESKVSDHMNKKPKFLTLDDDYHRILTKMKQWEIKQLPVLDRQGRVVRVEIYDELLGLIKRPNRVVLMAGGMGVRLRPLTLTTPKPLLPIAGIPILERIVQRFREKGFYKFTICVNYLGEQIKDYFGDGKNFGIEIEYITESKEMGTCGSLALLKHKEKDPLIVMNGDILTLANFGDLMNFHSAKESLATMCVKEYAVEIPYGTVKLNGHEIEVIAEKPRELFHINTGIYVLSPVVLELIPFDSHFDMPTLFSLLTERKMITHAYILRDYWLDIGRIEDYHKAQFVYEDAARKLGHD